MANHTSCNLSDLRPIQSLQNHVPTPKFIQPLITISYIEYQMYMISETKCTVCLNMDMKPSQAMPAWVYVIRLSLFSSSHTHAHISVATYNFNTIHDFCMLHLSLFLTQIIAVKLTQYYHHMACRYTKRNSNHFVYYVCIKCVYSLRCRQLLFDTCSSLLPGDRADCAHSSPYVYNLLYHTRKHTHACIAQRARSGKSGRSWSCARVLVTFA